MIQATVLNSAVAFPKRRASFQKFVLGADAVFKGLAAGHPELEDADPQVLPQTEDASDPTRVTPETDDIRNLRSSEKTVRKSSRLELRML
jgi:hypothetical protein